MEQEGVSIRGGNMIQGFFCRGRAIAGAVSPSGEPIGYVASASAFVL